MNQFSDEDIRRYSRHILLPEVGGAGQAKLRNAKVLLVGAGGLGAPIAYYLAAAGVGTLGIIDADVVELSNLQRQIIHGMHDLKKNKTLSAKEAIAELNPNVVVRDYPFRLTEEVIMEIVRDYDVVVDGSDNFTTRYLVNDACVLLRKPLSHGAVFRFHGQVTTIIPGEGPCYRCLYPAPPPLGLIATCEEAGVLGVLPGVIGLIQATEVLKRILGIGTLLIGALLNYDALEMGFKKHKMRRDPACPVCGANPSITAPVAFEAGCTTVRY